MESRLKYVDETPQSRKNGNPTRISEKSENRMTYLVGFPKAQSELLAAHIEKQSGMNCGLVSDLENAALSINQNGTRVLLLRDCYRKNKEMILTELELVYQQKLSGTLCCLFNLRKDTGVELEAVEYGVRGFIYEDDNLEQMLRCISGVLRGEIWLSRKDMSAYIRSKSLPGKNGRGPALDSQLTHRETEILGMLAAGNSNQEIGEALYISRHTVKTHVYNIYKKIDVSDRLQAALWATKHL